MSVDRLSCFSVPNKNCLAQFRVPTTPSAFALQFLHDLKLMTPTQNYEQQPQDAIDPRHSDGNLSLQQGKAIISNFYHGVTSDRRSKATFPPILESKMSQIITLSSSKRGGTVENEIHMHSTATNPLAKLQGAPIDRVLRKEIELHSPAAATLTCDTFLDTAASSGSSTPTSGPNTPTSGRHQRIIKSNSFQSLEVLHQKDSETLAVVPSYRHVLDSKLKTKDEGFDFELVRAVKDGAILWPWVPSDGGKRPSTVVVFAVYREVEEVFSGLGSYTHMQDAALQAEL